jgi:hypothetical protein
VAVIIVVIGYGISTSVGLNNEESLIEISASSRDAI